MLLSEILRIKGNTLYTTTPEGAVLDAVKAMADNDIGSLVVMDRGRIAEIGKHADLLAAGGMYAGLYNSQLGGGE